MRSVSSAMAVSMMIGTLVSAAQPARHFQPAFAGQHEVQHHELEMPVDESAPRLLAVARGGDPQALALQKFGQQVADLAVVIDDQYMGQGFHACYNSRFARGLCSGGCNW